MYHIYHVAAGWNKEPSSNFVGCGSEPPFRAKTGGPETFTTSET